MLVLPTCRISFFAIVIFTFIIQHPIVHADCISYVDGLWNNIVCSGSITETVEGTAQNDDIQISDGADVTAVESNMSGRLADAAAIGVVGENGNDRITNDGLIFVSATSLVFDGKAGDEYDTFGSSSFNGQQPVLYLISDTAAVGITGGPGEDEIKNSRIETVTANARSNSLKNFGSIVGSIGRVSSNAVGIAGDSSNDKIDNEADIFVYGLASVGTLTVSPSLSAQQSKKMDTDIFSTAIGIGGDGGDDRINNTGSVITTASAEIENLNLSINATGSTFADSLITVNADGRGIDGGYGDDEIVNQGFIHATATSSTTGIVNLHLDDYGSIKSVLNVIGDAVGIIGGGGNDNIQNEETIRVNFEGSLSLTNLSADLLNNGSVDSTLAISGKARGIAGGAGDDEIVNKKDTTVWSVSELDIFNLGLTGISWQWNTKENGGAWSYAYADGISGGDGNDDLTNEGTLTVSSSADVMSGTLSLTGAEFADFDVSSLAEAVVIGIDGGMGEDEIVNEGDMYLNATAAANMVSPTVTGFQLPWDTKGEGGLLAKSYVTGLDGNSDDDIVKQKGTLEVYSRASSSATNFTLDLAKLGSSDTSIQSTAGAAGLSGGLGKDKLFNESTTKVLSDARANKLEVAFSGVAINVLSDNDLSTLTLATTFGIKGDEGEDQIKNTSTIRTDTTAASSIESFNLDLFNLDLGFVGAPEYTAKTYAMSVTDGLDGGIGNDRIENLGTVDANAHATAFALNGDTSWKNLSLSFLELFGIDFGNAKIESKSEATGMDGGEGNDWIENSSVVKSISGATANSVGVGISIDIAGIGGEKDNKKPTNGGSSSAMVAGSEHGIVAQDHASAYDVVLLNDGSLLGDDKTVDPTLTVLNGNTIAESFSTGIGGDAGDDTIKNSGSVTAKATSRSSVTSVSLNVSFVDIIDPTDFLDFVSFIVAPLTVDYVNASSGAGATAWGLAGGLGDDRIYNTGSIDVKADSFTNSLSTIIDIQVAEVGIALGGNVTGSVVEGKTWATGIDGGLGADHIINEATIVTNSDAAANSIDVTALLVGVFGGLPVQAALTDSSTITVSESTGIYGGEGDDWIFNKDVGSITANGTSKAYAESISVEFKGATAISNFGASLAKATTNAASSATAVEGGKGKDQIFNEGVVNSKATSDTNGVSVSVKANGVSFMNVANLGGALADTSVTSVANAAGIKGGTGDDKIENGGSILSESIATLNGTSVAVTTSGVNAGSLVTGGAALSKTNATASSGSTGIEGGDGHDRIDNNSSVHAKSTTTASAGAVSVLVDQYGAAMTDTSLTATADATAIDGGAGRDTVTNTDSIIVENLSTGHATDVSVNLVYGFASAVSDTTVKANATGISGGDGHDHIENTGSIWVDNTANAYATGVSVDIYGVASAYGGIYAEANSTGIDGGTAGGSYNTLINADTIDTQATTLANAGGTTVNIIGHSYSDAQAVVNSHSTGIHGGTDKDAIGNSGRISSTATATARGGSVNIDLFGNAPANAGTIATAVATAIDSDTGIDEIENTGSLIATSISNANAGTTSVNLAGVAKADGGTTSSATSLGINGGDGGDKISSAGNITVSASATTDATDGSVNIFGAAISGGTLNASAKAAGVEAGTGDDIAHNEGQIRVTSGSLMVLHNTSFDLGGAALSGGRLTADNFSSGMSGDDGDDDLTNEGTITVDATSTLTSSGSIKAIFGYAGANGTTGAVTNATGIDGGAGEDKIRNLDAITVTSGSTLTMDGSSYTFGGVAGLGDHLTASTFSTGISGGDGPDRLWNEGTMTVKAVSTIDSKGGSNVTFGSSTAVSRITSDTMARGMQGGDLGDIIVNAGNIEVDATAKGTSEKSSYVFGGGTVTDAVLTTNADAYGISGNDGADDIVNKGMITARASSDLQATGGSRADFGTSKGNGKVSSAASARGIDGGDGHDVVNNLGMIAVEAKSYGYSKHNAQTGILFGKGDSRTSAESNVYGYGIDMGAGNNTVLNENEITVKVAAEANTDASGAGARIIDGDVYSQANSTVAAGAYGIRAEDGVNRITNQGLIDVRTTLENISPFAYSNASADGNGIDGDGTALSVAIVDTYAAGIKTGDGDNYIANNRDIMVQSIAHATANAFADADWFGSTSVTRTGSVAFRAHGIHTGNGNNHIVNKGNISVTGSYETTITTFQQSPVAEAYGIRTGNGDDSIVNDGSITTSIVRNGEISSGMGIDSGAGNDQVYLLDASSVVGSLNLGADNDDLIMRGTPSVTSPIFGGSGRDAIIFDGAGKSFLTYLEFEEVVKRSAGTFTAHELPAYEKLIIDDGVLQVEGDHQFVAGQSMQVALRGHGTTSELQVDGMATLAGALTITRESGAYVPGDSYQILSSNDPLQTTFDTITLPDATPLVSFSSTQTDHAIQVHANVKSFTNVATNRNAHAIASALDKVLANANGDMSQALGEIQTLRAAQDFRRAFSSLSPAIYGQLSRSSFSSVQQYSRSVNQRIRNIHESQALEQDSQTTEPMVVAYNGPDPRLLRDTTSTDLKQYGGWFKVFRQVGEQDADGSTDGYDYDINGINLGLDKIFGKQNLSGISVGVANTELEADRLLSDSDIHNVTGTLYAGYLSRRYYINAMLSYGKNEYDTQRKVQIGLITQPVTSSHTGHFWSSTFGAGMMFDLDGWWLEPYGYLQYTRLDEDSFQENNSGVGLAVASRTTESFVSELGLRLSRALHFNSGILLPDVGVGWHHDYDIDDQLINASYVGVPNSSFSIKGQPVNADGLIVDGGLTYRSNGGIVTSLRYSADLRDSYSAHSIYGMVRLEF